MKNPFGWKAGVSLGVGVFILLLVWSSESRSETWIGIGATTFNSESAVGMLEYRNDYYDAGVFIIGQGPSDGAYQEKIAPVISFARKWPLPIHKPLSLGLGFGYTGNIVLTEKFSFRLQMVYYFSAYSSLGAYHWSNAGISKKENTGLDLVTFAIRF